MIQCYKFLSLSAILCYSFKVMPMPKRGHVKLVVYVRREFKEDVRAEARQRKLTMGELVEEAFAQRMRLIRKPAQ